MSLADKYRDNTATTVVLIEAGIEMMRQNIRRRHPEASASMIESILRDWLNRTDDSIPGDTAGAVRIRERVS